MAVVGLRRPAAWGRGVSGTMDASIVPLLLGGSPNAPASMIADKGGAAILAAA